MSGGGKGSSTSTQTMKLPPWMEDAFKQGLSLSEERAKMGYVPHMGPDVAAFTQPQVNSMQQSSDIANLWGMGPETDIASQLPPAQDYEGGIRGYSSFPLYEQSQEALGAKYPGLKSYLDSFFIDPVTGKMAPDNPWDRAKSASSNDSKTSEAKRPRRTYIANGNEVVAPGGGRRG
jgi:hypothetical protein